ncbi:MAG: hypothetical protein FJX36_04930 [Alphaproteobacteria bacterium]|nr:hypothetical protein [Alphaproteobacteria bacterium]
MAATMCPRRPRSPRWSGRLGFVLAAIGSAVGLGSIWKFPYEVGANGGGAFIAFYLLGLVLVVVPLMLAEFAIGRRGRGDAATSLTRVALEAGGSRRWGAGRLARHRRRVPDPQLLFGDRRLDARQSRRDGDRRPARARRGGRPVRRPARCAGAHDRVPCGLHGGDRGHRRVAGAAPELDPPARRRDRRRDVLHGGHRDGPLVQPVGRVVAAPHGAGPRGGDGLRPARRPHVQHHAAAGRSAGRAVRRLARAAPAGRGAWPRPGVGGIAALGGPSVDPRGDPGARAAVDPCLERLREAWGHPACHPWAGQRPEPGIQQRRTYERPWTPGSPLRAARG